VLEYNLRPKANSYTFEPMSIAATLYKVYGIENPELITNGHGAVRRAIVINSL
jgi:hypothetical protein